MTSHRQKLSPATLALISAVDEELEGHTRYPERAVFVDADDAHIGPAIAEARADNRAVVLCYEDGTNLVLHPESPAAGA
jgi:hypothetical protein